MSDTPVLKIDYNELPVTDIDAAKAFYANAFGWTFEDYGPGYAAFTNAGLDGGLRLEGQTFTTGALIILMAEDLEAAEGRVEAAGRHRMVEGRPSAPVRRVDKPWVVLKQRVDRPRLTIGRSQAQSRRAITGALQVRIRAAG